MNAQKLGQAVALLFLVSSCSLVGRCKGDADCAAGAFCYGVSPSKKGTEGVCVRKENVPPDAFVDEPVDTPVEKPIGKPVGEFAIHSFSPSWAPHGAKLHIQGRNFSTVSSENSVTLNGVLATLVSATEDEIVIEVPKSLHCSGLISVTAEGKTATFASEFTYVPTATVSTVFDGQVSEPTGIAIAKDGSFYVADARGIHVGIPETGINPFVETELSIQNIAIAADGKLYGTVSSTHQIYIFSQGAMESFSGKERGSEDGPKTEARFASPKGIAMGAEGELYVADTDNHRIRMVTPQGEVSTLAGSSAGFDEGRGTEALFHSPAGVAIDASGNVYVADTANHRIRKITPDGEVSTLAGNGHAGFVDGLHARFDGPKGIAIDLAGNLLVIDSGNNRIRKVTPQGMVITLNDGPGNLVPFKNLHAIAIDEEGALYVVDGVNSCIQKITLE